LAILPAGSPPLLFIRKNIFYTNNNNLCCNKILSFFGGFGRAKEMKKSLIARPYSAGKSISKGVVGNRAELGGGSGRLYIYMTVRVYNWLHVNRLINKKEREREGERRARVVT
jgi:hypothetical protein